MSSIPVRALAGLLGAWTLVGVALAAPGVLMALVTEQRVPWRDSLDGFYHAAVWAALTPLVFAICRRFPLDRRRWPHNLATLVAGCAALFLLDRSLLVLTDELFGWIVWPPPAPVTLGDKVVRLAIAGSMLILVTYWALVAIGQAVHFRRLSRQRDLEASLLESHLAAVALRTLQMQLRPPFLFGTLRSISKLVEENPRAADRMIARLSDLLRLGLENRNRQEVALKEELEFLEPYVDVERMRLAGRLALRWEVHPEALDARVPHQILQPLVECVLGVTLGAAPGGGSLEIAARPRNGVLALDVRARVVRDLDPDAAALPPRDQRPGGADASAPRAAFSMAAEGPLETVRARLRHLYGEAHRLELRRAPDGLSVRVELPFESAGEAGELATAAASAHQELGRDG